MLCTNNYDAEDVLEMFMETLGHEKAKLHKPKPKK